MIAGPGACRPCAACGVRVTNEPHGWQAQFHARCAGTADGRHVPAEVRAEVLRRNGERVPGRQRRALADRIGA
jgi:hypothetical protein